MINFCSNLQKIKEYVGKQDFCSLQSYLVNPALELEFYKNVIYGKTEWFDVLDKNGIFDFKSFNDKIEENGQIINVPWNPFFYLQSVFPEIPQKIISIFKDIVKKHITATSIDLSWYVGEILKLLLNNADKLNSKDIMDVITPFKTIIPTGRTFYEVTDLLGILEILLKRDETEFVNQVLSAIFKISGEKSDDETEQYTFTSWDDYYYFLEKVEETGFLDKYPIISLNAFTSVLLSVNENNPRYSKLDLYGMDYIANQERAYQTLDCQVIAKIISFRGKIDRKGLDDFYQKLCLVSKENQTIQNILCYFASADNDLSISYAFLLKFVNELNYPFWGTSDYARLAIQKFDKLSAEQKEEILNERNKACAEYIEKRSTIEKEKIIKRFFMPFKKGLTSYYQEQYGRVLEEFDPDKYLEQDRDLIITDWVAGNVSGISNEKLTGKLTSEIVAFIKNFKGEDGANFRQLPTIKGTAETISKYINDNQNLLCDIELFEDEAIHPEYHCSLMLNLSFTEDCNISLEAVRHVIHYMSWISQLPLDFYKGRDTTNEHFIAEDTYSALLWMAQRIEEIVKFCSLTDVDYQNLLSILLRNIEKPDEAAVKERPQEDYYNLSINTFLGMNVEALIRLGLKMQELGNASMLEQITDRVISLVKEKNRVVFATIGRFYPWMKYVVGDRINELDSLLFAKDNDELFSAWFGAYLLNSVYLNIYSDVKNEYLYAVDKVFKENIDNRTFIRERLGDHLAVLYYMGLFDKNDALWNALFANLPLLKRAVWWICSSAVYKKGLDVDGEKVKRCIDEFICFVENNDKWEDVKDILGHLNFLLESDLFENDVNWLLDVIIKVLQHTSLDISHRAKIFENLRAYAKNPQYKDKVLALLKGILVRDEYVSKYYPQSSKCPYRYNENGFNSIFDEFIGDEMTTSQKEILLQIINALCNYGYYHNVEKYLQ